MLSRRLLSRRLLHTTTRRTKDKPPMPLRESLEIDDSPIRNAVVSSLILGALSLGYYLHVNDYMHTRDEGVAGATPAPLRWMVDTVSSAVPGAYDVRAKK